MKYSKIPITIVALLLMLAFIFGCSSSTPTVPDQSESFDVAPSIGVADHGGVLNGIGILGAYELHLDTDNLSADLTAVRSTAIGESYIVSGLGFFTSTPCADCLNVHQLGLDMDFWGSLVNVTFDIRHPFPPGDPSQPPTAMNRLDLDIFDPALVIVPKDATSTYFPGIGQNAYTDVCANADAFTSELTMVSGDPYACPYFLVLDDSETGTVTNNRFVMGDSTQFDVVFRQGGMFKMYLTFGYGASARRPERLEPKYYIPEFNRKAAWKVEVIPPHADEIPSMENTWNDSDTTAPHDVTVKVYDWQQGAVVTDNPEDYANEPDTSKVYAASEVNAVSLEIPGLFDSIKQMHTPDSGTGTPTDPLVYTFSVANESGLGAGNYSGLVKVADSRSPLLPASGRDHLIHTPDGLQLNNHMIPEYAAYQIFPVAVVSGVSPITGSIVSPDCPFETIPYRSIFFTAEASTSPECEPIVLYEWDQNYDGVTFNVDGTGETVQLHSFLNPNCGTTNEPVIYNVTVRATDSCDPPNTAIFATCEVKVVCEMDSRIRSVHFTDKPRDDTWYDIAAGGDDYFVFVVADHPETNNVERSRTAIRYRNEGNNLVEMTVLNREEGMNDIWGWGFREYFDKIAVTEHGRLVTNTGRVTMQLWEVHGEEAHPSHHHPEPLYKTCSSEWSGQEPIIDVWDMIDPRHGHIAMSATATNDCGDEYFWGFMWLEDAHATVGHGLNRNWLYKYEAIAAIDGYDHSDNVVWFISHDSANVAFLSLSGPWTDEGMDGVREHIQVGRFGTDDNEFSGGLDVATNAENRILTLEDHDGSYRFQAFDPELNWIFSEYWMGSDAPMRIDFHRHDSHLYLLTDQGIHICEIDW